MSTIAVKGNGNIILDDIDIYSSNNLPFESGMSLGELVFTNENISFLSMVMANDIAREFMRMEGTASKDPYSIASGPTYDDKAVRNVIMEVMTTIAVRHNFRDIKLTRANFRTLVTKVNRKFVREELITVVGKLIVTEDAFEEEAYKRGHQMIFPWGTDRKKSGFAPTGHSYGTRFFHSTKLIDRDESNFSTVIDSKVAPHYSWTGPNTDKLYAQSVYEKVTSRMRKK